jgi:hypothetical protein
MYGLVTNRKPLFNEEAQKLNIQILMRLRDQLDDLITRCQETDATCIIVLPKGGSTMYVKKTDAQCFVQHLNYIVEVIAQVQKIIDQRAKEAVSASVGAGASASVGVSVGASASASVGVSASVSE